MSEYILLSLRDRYLFIVWYIYIINNDNDNDNEVTINMDIRIFSNIAQLRSWQYNCIQQLYSQEPINGEEQSDVLDRQPHSRQHDHHGDEPGLRDGSCTNGSHCSCNAAWRHRKITSLH